MSDVDEEGKFIFENTLALLIPEFWLLGSFPEKFFKEGGY